MATSLYLTDEYLTKHPSWHVEDSAWKANHVLGLLKRHKIEAHSICEIGCGAGEVLAEMQRQMTAACSFTGYEFSPHAFRMCLARENETLRFNQGDGLASDKAQVDVALALDVVEHVDDYPQFMRQMRERARFCVFHIPLDLSVLSLLTGLPQRVRTSAGHLHYFTRALALQALEESGFKVLEARYTRPAIERPNGTVRGQMALLPRLLLSSVSEDAAALLLGGFSLVVLAQAKGEL